MSPDVATALLADLTQAALGGEVAEVTVLFKDLRGFTPFSERTTPDRVVAMLNQYFGRPCRCCWPTGARSSSSSATPSWSCSTPRFASSTTPCGRPGRPWACRRRSRRSPSARPNGPVLVGINTGPALIGNIGSDEFRNFTAIGDTVNLAARLEQEVAEAGQVVLGPTTQAAISTWPSPAPSTPSRSRASATPSPAGSSKPQGRPHHLGRRSRPPPTPRRLWSVLREPVPHLI